MYYAGYMHRFLYCSNVKYAECGGVYTQPLCKCFNSYEKIKSDFKLK